MAFEYACTQDIRAIKPGNVSMHQSIGDMEYKDFLRSAIACSDTIADPKISLCKRIKKSIEMTKSVVGCNTNLGIILLCAPLSNAIFDDENHVFKIDSLEKVIKNISKKETKIIYKSINKANPGGMGNKHKYDLKDGTSDFDLYTAMNYAKEYDSIANEYVTNFSLIFNTLSKQWGNYYKKWGNPEYATTATFLYHLRDNYDSLIARKHGVNKARKVSELIKPLANEYISSKSPNELNNRLLILDYELKNERINPGTTADLITASIFVNRLNLLS